MPTTFPSISISLHYAFLMPTPATFNFSHVDTICLLCVAMLSSFHYLLSLLSICQFWLHYIFSCLSSSLPILTWSNLYQHWLRNGLFFFFHYMCSMSWTCETTETKQGRKHTKNNLLRNDGRKE